MKKNVVIFLLGAVSGSSLLTWLVLRSKRTQSMLVEEIRDLTYDVMTKYLYQDEAVTRSAYFRRYEPSYEDLRKKRRIS